MIEAPQDMVALFTIYEDPDDYRGQIVVRRHIMTNAGSVPDAFPLYVGDSIPAARLLLERRGLYCLGRNDMDGSTVVESWI